MKRPSVLEAEGLGRLEGFDRFREDHSRCSVPWSLGARSMNLNLKSNDPPISRARDLGISFHKPAETDRFSLLHR